MELFDRYSPPETRLFARRLRSWAIAVLVLAAVLALILDAFAPNRPVERAGEREHFIYGSIGADISAGLPLKIMQVLPETFAHHLPPGAPRDWTAFGFIQELGEAMPIGFSTRRQVIDLVGINCGTCHTGTVRERPGAEAMVIPGMPAVTLDLYAFFRFLFHVAADEEFTADTILAAIERKGIKGPLDGLIYARVVPLMQQELLARERRTRFLFEPGYPRFGPGRVNTFDTFKVDQFRYYYKAHGQALDPEEMFGNVDFPSVWNQRPREGLRLHWDGNQSSVRERNFSAAIGAGARPEDMDVARLLRIERWLADLPPPAYPYAIDRELAVRGEPIYRRLCFDCHDFAGAQIAQVEDLETIGTDPYRVYSYTQFILEAQQDYTKGHFWAFRNFTKTNGYSSHPLDGLWARAPYLHNGSVPSMWELLSPEDRRPEAFELGVDVYDQARMGFAAERLIPASDGFVRADGTRYDGGRFVLDLRLKGNSAAGHSGAKYGTDLSDADKRALIEFLKTL